MIWYIMWFFTTVNGWLLRVEGMLESLGRLERSYYCMSFVSLVYAVARLSTLYGRRRIYVECGFIPGILLDSSTS